MAAHFGAYLSARLKEREALAQRAAGERADLMALLSHDIRSPLFTILGYAEMLREPIPRHALSKEQQDFVYRIETSARQILNLVANFLHLGKMEDEKEEHSPVDLNDLVRRVVGDYACFAQIKAVGLSYELDPHFPRVLGDAALLERVVANLLDNALKYTPQGGTVRVVTAQADHMAIIRVIDTGPGIDPALLPQLLEKHYRGKSTQHAQGTGLGLHIVDRVIRAHRGTVTVHSQAGIGTTFEVILPAITSDRSDRDLAAASVA